MTGRARRGTLPCHRDRTASNCRRAAGALLADSAGIAVVGPRLRVRLRAVCPRGGFSPIEAMAMSVIVFAGAAQFAAVGYVASGLAWPGIILLTALLNARHLLYSASLRPWLQRRATPPSRGDGPPPDRRGIRALDQPLPADRPDRRARLLARRRSSATFIPWNLATPRRGAPGRADPRSGAARHRRHLPGRDDRARGRADHRPARAGRGDRRGGCGGRGRAGLEQPVDRDRQRRDHRPAGRPARPDVGSQRDAPLGSPESPNGMRCPACTSIRRPRPHRARVDR